MKTEHALFTCNASELSIHFLSRRKSETRSSWSRPVIQ